MATPYCGCCGREIPTGDWCDDCLKHLGPRSLPEWERTYFARHHKPCPYDVGDPDGKP